MDSVNRDILLLVLFALTFVSAILGVVEDEPKVSFTSYVISGILCVICFYLVALRG